MQNILSKSALAGLDFHFSKGSEGKRWCKIPTHFILHCSSLNVERVTERSTTRKESQEVEGPIQ